MRFKSLNNKYYKLTRCVMRDERPTPNALAHSFILNQDFMLIQVETSGLFTVDKMEMGGLVIVSFNKENSDE